MTEGHRDGSALRKTKHDLPPTPPPHNISSNFICLFDRCPLLGQLSKHIPKGGGIIKIHMRRQRFLPLASWSDAHNDRGKTHFSGKPVTFLGDKNV